MSVTQFTEQELKDLEEKTTIPRFLFLPLGLIGLWCLAVYWPSQAIGWQIFWTLFTSYCLFCWTSCFHECSHHTLSGSKNASIWLGRVLGTAMFVPYTVYRESHIRHHAYLNKPSDWELWPYSDPNTSLRFRRIFIWFDLGMGLFMAPYIYGRIFWHKDSPLTDPKVRQTIRYEYAVMVLFWGSVLGLCAYYGVLWDLARVWFLPHYLAGIYQNTRKFTEHLGMSSYDPMLGTRTVVGSNLITKLCTYFNFDIFVHGPHHRHPRIAHNLLLQKMDDYQEKNPDVKYPVFTTYWGAIIDMAPAFLFKPGVGMNAGAPPPGKEKKQIDNFVQDVAKEVIADDDLVTKPVD
ncbi:fatty acid desaturase family protein [Gimesia maris]|uniref:Fatty acid desaturase n=1 Tax=Gimesia maris TaxID=122 RepID=A0A3D3RF76_9PLAN|nr:fatty acid desaturase [Gimesia maris]MAC53580.1 fatty acid desaturase [Gimesia sp.]EDL56403.1 Fatty acid desaturase [Gimesia maris DSM 8797]QEG15431.1 Fatty acid desaturase [Gimesia maris]QGQ31255.1 fatty acid desaturase [Gimesia maris]HCO26687.1 fatty acid desaturase [Gimesia maris]